MKALSLSQPWCWAVVSELVRKHVENRSWQPPIAMIGQVIAIHAAKSWDDRREYHLRTCPLKLPVNRVCPRDGERACPLRNAVRDRMCTLGEPGTGLPLTPIGYLLHYDFEPPARRELYASSAIVGVATIDRIVTRPDTLADDQKRWFFGPFGWVLSNVRRLEEPVPATGKQGLWNVPDDLEAGIWAQLPRAA